MKSTSSYTHFYPEGAVIYFEGEPGNNAFIIEKGRVEVSITRKGNKQVLAEYSAGDLVGEMSLIDNSPRSATVTALEPTEVITIYRSLFDIAMNDVHPVVSLMIRTIMYHRRKTNPSPLSKSDQDEYYDLKKKKDPEYQHDRAEAVNLIMAEKELSEAIDNQQFELYYQPITSFENNKIVGMEALIRWNHPEGDVISAGEIIPIAEKTSLIKKLGEYIIDSACSDFSRLARDLPGINSDCPDFFISINLSAKQLIYTDFLENIKSSILNHNVDPSRIMLEITENILMQDPESALNILNKLKQLGFQVTIDDFGNGYSSMGYLHAFPIDYIKIDHSFIETMYTRSTSMTIIRSIIDLAKAVDLKVIAEGVETEDQLNIVREFGADMAQGFFLSEPMPYPDVVTLLNVKL